MRHWFWKGESLFKRLLFVDKEISSLERFQSSCRVEVINRLYDIYVVKLSVMYYIHVNT